MRNTIAKIRLVAVLVVGMVAVISIVLLRNNWEKQATILRLLTHDSYDIGSDVIARFEQENDVKLEFIKGGDAGMVLNTAILNRNNPVADLLFGVDNTFLSRALGAEMFEVYESPFLSQLKEAVLVNDTRGQLTPVSYGDVCLNYDKSWFEQRKIAVPATLGDLTDPTYNELLAVQNPASSSPGLAFLLSTIGYFGEDGYEQYWIDLRENGVRVSDSWEQVYWSDFSATSDGDRPLVVSYATSPAAEVYFSEGAYQEPPTGVISSPGSCFRQIEYAGILRGTEHLELARKFVDFMLSREYQEDIFLHMWVFPGLAEAQIPGEYSQFVPDLFPTSEVPPEKISSKREEWIDRWSEILIRSR